MKYPKWMDEELEKVDTEYTYDKDNHMYRLIGILLDKEDYYYAMYNQNTGEHRYISCVGSLEMVGFEEKD